jgi:hypothetical protein
LGQEVKTCDAPKSGDGHNLLSCICGEPRPSAAITTAAATDCVHQFVAAHDKTNSAQVLQAVFRTLPGTHFAGEIDGKLGNKSANALAELEKICPASSVVKPAESLKTDILNWPKTEGVFEARDKPNGVIAALLQKDTQCVQLWKPPR